MHIPIRFHIPISYGHQNYGEQNFSQGQSIFILYFTEILPEQVLQIWPIYLTIHHFGSLCRVSGCGVAFASQIFGLPCCHSILRLTVGI